MRSWLVFIAVDPPFQKARRMRCFALPGKHAALDYSQTKSGERGIV